MGAYSVKHMVSYHTTVNSYTDKQTGYRSNIMTEHAVT